MMPVAVGWTLEVEVVVLLLLPKVRPTTTPVPKPALLIVLPAPCVAQCPSEEREPLHVAIVWPRLHAEWGTHLRFCGSLMTLYALPSSANLDVARSTLSGFLSGCLAHATSHRGNQRPCHDSRHARHKADSYADQAGATTHIIAKPRTTSEPAACTRA